jgi:hypothetical protein
MPPVIWKVPENALLSPLSFRMPPPGLAATSCVVPAPVMFPLTVRTAPLFVVNSCCPPVPPLVFCRLRPRLIVSVMLFESVMLPLPPVLEPRLILFPDST